MMSRLPNPGGDDGDWGTILNDFLSTAHNADGTLKSASVTAAGAAADSAVLHNSGTETVAGVKTFSSSPIVPTPSSPTQAANKSYVDSTTAAGAPDATTTSKGIVQLAGDLAGTATSPTVPGLAAKAADSVVVHLAGSETVTGAKNFTGGLQTSGQAVVATNDARLTDARTPSDSSVTDAKIATTLSPSKITGTAVVTADARLSDTRTPTDASVTTAKIAAGGIAQSAVTNLVTDLASKEQGITPTAVKTSAYTAVAGDFVPVDTTSGAVTITLPTAPTDKSRIVIKLVTMGVGNNVTIARGGTDVFNKTGGATSLTLQTTNQEFDLQYQSSTGIWYALPGNSLAALDTRYLGQPLALTGATSATRYVGGTVSGAPTTGTFAVGDFVVDQTGIVWVCTSAGTPGGWVDASSSGRELAYTENRTGTNVTTTSTSTFVDITGLSISVPASTRPVWIAWTILISNTTATLGTVQMTEVSNGVDTPIGRQHTLTLAAGAFVKFDGMTRVGTTARTRNFKLQMSKTNAGTLTGYAGLAADPTYESYITAFTR